MGESPADEAIEAHVHHGCTYERRRWVIYVCAVVLSDLYIVNKSNAPRDVSGVTEQKNERAVCRGLREARGSTPTAFRSLIFLFGNPLHFSRSFRFVHYVLIRNYDFENKYEAAENTPAKSLLRLKRSTHLISHCLIVRLSMAPALLGQSAAAATQTRPFEPGHNIFAPALERPIWGGRTFPEIFFEICPAGEICPAAREICKK